MHRAGLLKGKHTTDTQHSQACIVRVYLGGLNGKHTTDTQHSQSCIVRVYRGGQAPPGLARELFANTALQHAIGALQQLRSRPRVRGEHITVRRPAVHVIEQAHLEKHH